MRPIRRRVLAAMMPAAVLIGACSFTQPAPIKQTFLLHAGDDRRSVPLPQGRDLLEIGSFRVVTPFAGKALVYRLDDVRYESDYYNEFFVAPGAAIASAVAQRLGQSSRFETLPPGSAVPARYRLQGVVTQLYGDFRDKERPAAVLGIQFYLVRIEKVVDTVALAHNSTQRVELSNSTAPALVDGFGRALDRALADFDEALRAIGPP